ncbi:MAG: arsenosugar biosynthesis radical SAM (seleno)protein ArsS [Thermodesulfobacteriota bacterium]
MDIHSSSEDISSHTFDGSLVEAGLRPLAATGLSTLQVNVGKLCNKSCRHCHVGGGAGMEEVMTRETFNACLDALSSGGLSVVDITGGAPEMNPSYRWFVESCRGMGGMGLHVKTRTNLTIMLEDGYTELPAFFAENSVEVIASLPCYSEGTTDEVRGKGTFRGSLEALSRLNQAGYGKEGSGLLLNLVYNPSGAFLPPVQSELEAAFRRELLERYDISFNGLFVLTNMPVGRFADSLEASGSLDGYRESLVSSFNPVAAENVMCRTTVSVGWDGSLYDCDFNQMLRLGCASGAPGHIREFDRAGLKGRRIVTGPHCYGCTAGAGSSCGGQTV